MNEWNCRDSESRRKDEGWSWGLQGPGQGGSHIDWFSKRIRQLLVVLLNKSGLWKERSHHLNSTPEAAFGLEEEQKSKHKQEGANPFKLWFLAFNKYLFRQNASVKHVGCTFLFFPVGPASSSFLSIDKLDKWFICRRVFTAPQKGQFSRKEKKRKICFSTISQVWWSSKT